MRYFFPSPRARRRPGLRSLGWLIAVALAVSPAARAAGGADDFGAMVRLAPFVVDGRPLSISIHARSSGDRRYAAAFAEEVVAVVAEAVTPETGRGLVIIGRKGEPHPIAVFRRFLALARAGRLDPAVAARAPELDAMLHRWEDRVNRADRGDGDRDDLAFDRIIQALPLGLEGLGARLYQLAWMEGFAPAGVEARFRALKVADLEDRFFASYDWVFYLPPKRAFDQVLDDIVADALKDEDAGLFARLTVKGVMLAVKPRIRRVIEAVRRGLLFETVVEARTPLDREGADALMDAYVDQLLPDEDRPRAAGPEHARAVEAVRVRWRELRPAAPAAAALPPQ